MSEALQDKSFSMHDHLRSHPTTCTKPQYYPKSKQFFKEKETHFFKLELGRGNSSDGDVDPMIRPPEIKLNKIFIF